MKKYILLFFFLPLFLFSQNEKKFSLEAQGSTFTGIGNNFIAEGLKTFTGFGVGISSAFYKNMGLGLAFQKGYSEVKDVSVFGSLQNPQLTSVEIFGLYRFNLTNKFDVEANLGYAKMFLISRSAFREKGFTEDGEAFLIGGKALYSLNKNNSIYLVGTPRFYFLSTKTQIDNSGADKYYSKPTLFNFALGIRIYL